MPTLTGWEVVTAGAIPDGTRVRFTPAYGGVDGSSGEGVVAYSYRNDENDVTRGFTYQIRMDDSTTASRGDGNEGESITVLREADEVPPIVEPVAVERVARIPRTSADALVMRCRGAV